MSTPFIGEIRLFGGNFAPAGWAFCNGQLMSIAENDVLFTLIGTTYGGDGQQTFGLPNLQSRFPRHASSGLPLGQASGTESVTLTSAQIPPHSHTALAATGAAATGDPSNASWAAWPDVPYSTVAPTVAMNAAAISPSGANRPHDNMSPYLAVSFIISLFGIFPTQN
ncbi:phage tail protein [Luethyella okanaganae]|uniref:Phage tail protein n=1 Tax=Luethyella okanaganae TaxID=69372 RepID=A0ABW1VGB9_9MICO